VDAPGVLINRTDRLGYVVKASARTGTARFTSWPQRSLGRPARQGRSSRSYARTSRDPTGGGRASSHSARPPPPAAWHVRHEARHDAVRGIHQSRAAEHPKGGIESHAKLLGHPVHQMLIILPVGRTSSGSPASHICCPRPPPDAPLHPHHQPNPFEMLSSPPPSSHMAHDTHHAPTDRIRSEGVACLPPVLAGVRSLVSRALHLHPGSGQRHPASSEKARRSCPP
jgi:hypothetical protein